MDKVYLLALSFLANSSILSTVRFSTGSAVHALPSRLATNDNWASLRLRPQTYLLDWFATRSFTCCINCRSFHIFLIEFSITTLFVATKTCRGEIGMRSWLAGLSRPFVITTGVLLQEGKRIGPAAAADIEELCSPREIDAPCHESRGAKRAGVLGAAEGRAADAAFGIDNSFIEALVGKHWLTSHRFIKMAQSLVQEAAIEPVAGTRVRRNLCSWTG